MKHTLITSRSNPWVQQWLRFQSKPAERKAAGYVWLEGEHLVTEALNRADVLQHTLESLVVPNTDNGLALLQRLSAQYLAANGKNTVSLTDGLYQSLCTMDSAPNVCAVLRLKASSDTGHSAIDFTSASVVLDTVQDPGNVGTLIRLCAAFGVPQVLLSSGCASAWSAKALRAGQGAQLAVAVHEDVDLAQAYSGFEHNTLPLAATSLAAGSLPLNQTVLVRRMVWIFGNEGQGVSATTQQAATQWVHIPMQGGFESLNVGTAAAICLWQWQQFSQ